MKNLLFISEDKERALIQELVYKMKMAELPIHPKDTCFLSIAPDYSGIASQIISHSLTTDREIFNIESVNIPYPDEDKREYLTEFTQNFMKWQRRWDKFVLIQSGVVWGDNLMELCNIMTRAAGAEIYAVALCESQHSRFKCNLVSLHYDSDQFDLHFWWEQPNIHYPCNLL
tara:strand:+ start:92 stop:607 length:516 start_codon:yes stop_codon:yes gene_type:complete